MELVSIVVTHLILFILGIFTGMGIGNLIIKDYDRSSERSARMLKVLTNHLKERNKL